MSAKRKQSPDDLLTARAIANEYGIDQATVESLLKQRDREGKVVRLPDFRRRFIRRGDIGFDNLPRRRGTA